MQAVGRPCARCKKRLAWVHEGVCCPACEVAYHYACMKLPPDGDRLAAVCPRCHRPFQAMEQEAEQAFLDEADAQDRRLSRWKTLGFLALAIATLGTVWVLAQSALGGGAPLSRSVNAVVIVLIAVGVSSLFRVAWDVYDYLKNR